jgi:hypothetical protein
LDATAGDEGIATLTLRFGNTKFELTDFIARHFDACHLIALHPKINATKTFRKTLKLYERCWQVSQMQSRWITHLRKLSESAAYLAAS